MRRNAPIAGLLALWLYRLGTFLSQRLPLRATYLIAEILADVHFLLRGAPRRALLSNLDVVCGESLTRRDRRRMARAIFRNFGRAVVDFLRLSALDAETLTREISAEGLEELDLALRSGVGAILLTGHIGGWEVGGAYLATLGYPLAVMSREHSTPAVTQFFRDRRRRWGIRDLGSGDGNGVLTGLIEQGKSIAVLGDWVAGGRGTVATFFGRATRVPFGYVNLAARTGGRIVPGVVLRTDAGGYRVHLDEAIPLKPDDLQGTLDRCLRVLERYIRENLTEWFAFNPIWPEEATGGGGGS